ncbi:hypothetical protein QUF55_03175 [Clostridiaceae bacterium HSG29]|nr:hypothetical protein [Clostridiaceae bacterium HSG29]
MAKVQMTEEEFINNWELTRKNGFLRFIAIQGGLSWGLFSGIIYMALILIFGLFMDIPSSDLIFSNKVFQMLLFIIFGVLLGVFMWFRNEKKYLKRKPYNKKR